MHPVAFLVTFPIRYEELKTLSIIREVNLYNEVFKPFNFFALLELSLIAVIFYLLLFLIINGGGGVVVVTAAVRLAIYVGLLSLGGGTLLARHGQMRIVTAASGQGVMHRVVNGIERENRWRSLF